ncbi:MAG: hypothetical protein FWE15_02420 [Actinomycetia bacterium]|nr:hypothetical protein [Actinomycetes bacterium]
MIPHIRQDEGQIGFYWVTPAGDPVTLSELMETDAEPERLLPTHMSALDDALIDAVGRWGSVLGGGDAPSETERAELTELTRAIDRLLHEYAVAERRAGAITETRSGQIAGTASLVGACARQALGTFGPEPFEGQLDDPRTGVMSGHGQFHYVDPAAQWRGGRWLLVGLDERRFPLTLEMLLGGSGVEKDAAVKEHRDALRAVTQAAVAVTSGLTADTGPSSPDPAVAARAVDYLLFDWLMANRESPSSAAIEIRSGDSGDAVMIVAAADAAAVARAADDPGRLEVGA